MGWLREQAKRKRLLEELKALIKITPTNLEQLKEICETLERLYREHPELHVKFDRIMDTFVPIEEET